MNLSSTLFSHICMNVCLLLSFLLLSFFFLGGGGVVFFFSSFFFFFFFSLPCMCFVVVVFNKGSIEGTKSSSACV